MNKAYKSIFSETLFVTLAAAIVASPVLAIPPDPDNAALLYYQAFLTLAQLSDKARDHIEDVAQGKVPPDDQVRQDISKCVGAIEFAEAAARVPTCHWGVRYSQGVDALMPQLAQMRFLTFAMIADARLRASDGDYRGAFERCLTTGTFARHVGDDTLISYLVSISVRGLAYKCMQDVMGRAASDAELLQWLKNELVTSPGEMPSPVRPLKIELEIFTDLMQMKNVDKFAGILANSDAEKIAEIVEAADEKTFERARRIYSDRLKSGLTVLSTPTRYEQAHSQLKQLTENFDPNDPASAVAGAFAPSLAGILSARTRAETHANAIMAAIEILLSRARMGRLPDALPSGLPKDTFSGEDFEYERTKGGFVLRCRAKDLNKDEIHQYEFKIPK